MRLLDDFFAKKKLLLRKDHILRLLACWHFGKWKIYSTGRGCKTGAPEIMTLFFGGKSEMIYFANLAEYDIKIDED